MTVISSTRTRNPDGSWGGWSTTVEEPPATAQQPVTLVDHSDPQAMAAWRAGAAPTPQESSAAIRRRMRRADFADRCAREDREYDPRDTEPTDYDR